MVPAGGIALVSPAAAHRIPEVFRDPDRYDPDRFAPGRQEDRKHRHALIGFGGGHHRCIGSTFAYQQIKAIWSVLLQRFELSLDRAATTSRTTRRSCRDPASRASCGTGGGPGEPSRRRPRGLALGARP